MHTRDPKPAVRDGGASRAEKVRDDNRTAPPSDDKIRLHLGCGKRFIPGFVHVDILPAPHIDHVADVRHLEFAAENSADLIYACHVLEHFGRFEFRAVLAEWFRVLKPGGILRLSVPDFAACAAVYYEQGLVDGLTGLMGLISGGQRDEFDFHKMIFDEPFLSQELLKLGFTAVRRWDWRLTEHAHVDDFSQAYIPHLARDNGRHMSLNLEAVK
jgi:SAM-dependent methyltransferase